MEKLLSYSLTGVVYGYDGEVYHVGESSFNRKRIDDVGAYYISADNFKSYNLILSITDLDTKEINQIELKNV